jgi:hypothetical protein
MDWAVLWSSDADDKLAALWMDESIRADVTKSANEIDRRLRSNPNIEGESRPNSRRVLFVAPLAVTFEVLPNHRVVRVLDVWRYARRHRSNGSQ